MSILCSMVGATFASGAVQSNTWTTYNANNTITGISQYTGLNNSGVAIHGVQNTDNLVFVFGTQNSTRTAHTLYPACLNLTTGAFAVGSGVSVGNSSPTDYIEASVSGEGNIGMVSTTTLVSANWRNYARGYTISNWGSISTTTLPTLTLSTAYTKSTNGSGHYVGYLGNNRFGISSRDSAAGDTNIMDVLTHNGASAPTLFRAGVAGGARAAGFTQPIRAGISSTNFAAYYSMVGNNANTVVNQFVQGNSSNNRVFSNDGNLGSVAGNYHNGIVVNDVSGNVIILTQINNAGVGPRHSVSRWTNANSPTANPSVTTSATYQTTYGPFDGLMYFGDKTQSKVYVPMYVSGSAVRYDILNINGTSLNITSQTTGVNATHPWNGDMYWYSFYHPTYGQWIINHRWIGGTINFSFNKWNP